MTLQVNRKHFTVDEYYQLAETGIIKPTDRVELIEGDIITMSPINSNHAGKINKLVAWFFANLYPKATIISQNPLRISDTSEPEPDIMLATFDEDTYQQAHPTPQDVYLIIEVADSSLAYDQSIKTSLYAKAGIPEYWIVNLADQQVEIYLDPKDGNYSSKQIIKSPADIEITAFELRIPFEIIFPQR